MHEKANYDPTGNEHLLDVALSEYATSMASCLGKHFKRCSSVAEEHRAFLLQSGNGIKTDPQALFSRLNDTSAAVGRLFERNTEAVVDIAHSARQSVIDMLNPEDWALFRDARAIATISGALSPEVQEILSDMSSPQARFAARVGLDSTVLSRLYSEAFAYDGSTDLHSIAREASCSSVYDAFMSGAAGILLPKTKILLDGNSGLDLDNVLGYIPEGLRFAARSYLDKILLQSMIAEFNASGRFSTDTLDKISCGNIKSVRDMFEKAVFASGTNSRKKNSGNANDDDKKGQESGAPGGSGGSDDEKGDRQDASGGGESGVYVDGEVKLIVEKVTWQDRSYSWLTSYDPREVRRVISTVRTLRGKAAGQGEEITDRQIFLRYRRAVETIPADDTSERARAIQSSYRIIEAFMGGNIRGKLPF